MAGKVAGVHWTDLNFTADFTADVYHPYTAPLVQTSVSLSGNTIAEETLLGVTQSGKTGFYAPDGISDYDPIAFDTHLTQPILLIIGTDTTRWYLQINSSKTWRELEMQ
ncbi:MAG: hypothetical protein P8P30_06540 [Rickettsiales bacterium]|nr:hypothetical protein [Rickettsiales bacterium]